VFGWLFTALPFLIAFFLSRMDPEPDALRYSMAIREIRGQVDGFGPYAWGRGIDAEQGPEQRANQFPAGSPNLRSTADRVRRLKTRTAKWRSTRLNSRRPLELLKHGALLRNLLLSARAGFSRHAPPLFNTSCILIVVGYVRVSEQFLHGTYVVTILQ